MNEEMEKSVRENSEAHILREQTELINAVVSRMKMMEQTINDMSYKIAKLEQEIMKQKNPQTNENSTLDTSKMFL